MLGFGRFGALDAAGFVEGREGEEDFDVPDARRRISSRFLAIFLRAVSRSTFNRRSLSSRRARRSLSSSAFSRADGTCGFGLLFAAM